MIFRIVFAKKNIEAIGNAQYWNTRTTWRFKQTPRVLIHKHILARRLANFGHTLQTRECLFIKVYNLQADRQSLEIPGNMQNPACISVVHVMEKGKRGGESEIRSLVLPEYSDISGSHCSLNLRAHPIYPVLNQNGN